MKPHLWSMSLIGLALLALTQSLYAADWTCGDVDCLRNAIKEANGNGEANTLRLEAGHYILMMAHPTAEGEESGLSVTGTIHITGADPEHPEQTVLERAATDPPFRLVYVARTGNLTIEGLTISGGRTSSLGGGILIEGELHLRNIDMVGNAARAGGGFATNVEGKVTLWSTIVARNTAEETGPACHQDKLGSVISLGNNLIDDPTGCNLALRADDLTWVSNDGYGADLLNQPSGTGGPAVAAPRVAFVTNTAPGTISQYTIDASGRMSANGSVAACQEPVGLAIDNTHRWLYVACSGKSFQIAVFRIESTGGLTLLQRMPVSGSPSAVAVHPSNCCLYVTKSLALPVEAGGSPGSTSFTLQRYTIDPPTGLLAFAEEQRTQGADPDVVVVAPQGDLAFVGNTSGASVMTFRTDPISGRMTPIGLTPTGDSPTSMVVTPQGDLLIVGCKSKYGVYMYAIDRPSGRLTQVYHTGSFAAGLGVSPDGASLMATYWDDKTVVVYTIDHAARKLVLRQTVVDTGGRPSTFNGSVMFNGVGSFYVVNSVNQTGYQAGNVQRFTVDAAGKVMAQEYVPAGYQAAALATAK
jgi:6-phosphogluconolactonase (cycloisomerase 2 family)